MCEHLATIVWNRPTASVAGARNGTDLFTSGRFSRAHEWTFDGGARIAASPSPHVLPPPMSVAANVDPEEAFVAALASCHMLFFLSIAARRGFVIDEYVDPAVGLMSKNEDGKLALTTVRLRPRVVSSGDGAPTPEQIERMHHRAHQLCYLANSVNTNIEIEL